MDYKFKPVEELGWAVFTALLTFTATELVGFHPEDVTDWRRWAIVAAGGLARAVGAGVAVWLTKATTNR